MPMNLYTAIVKGSTLFTCKDILCININRGVNSTELTRETKLRLYPYHWPAGQSRCRGRRDRRKRGRWGAPAWARSPHTCSSWPGQSRDKRSVAAPRLIGSLPPVSTHCRLAISWLTAGGLVCAPLLWPTETRANILVAVDNIYINNYVLSFIKLHLHLKLSTHQRHYNYIKKKITSFYLIHSVDLID